MKELIERKLQEAGKMVKLSSGKEAAFGSKEHIKDLETRIRVMTSQAKSSTKGSRRRENLQRTLKQLRSQLKSAKKMMEAV